MQVCSNCSQENAEAARFCQACGTPLQPKAPPREVRKTVTVVFTDVTGSTDLGERLDPESLRRVMNRYFEEMKAALEHHGGTVEKFIGDAVMAVFGIPTIHEDDALRAVRAAHEMRTRLETLNDELERDRGVRLLTRTGVNTGEVVAGDSSAGQTLVTGDAVNVAARLEQAAQPGEILIGEPTHRLVRHAVQADPLEHPLALKGKEQAVPAFRLVKIQEGVIPERHLDSPMVGRERELGGLMQAFDSAVANRACHLFTVLGSAGVGKSRLVEEFLRAVETRATVLRGRCLPYGDGITFWPVKEFVEAAAGIVDTDPPEEARAKVTKLVADDEDRDVIADRVAEAMGLREATAPSEEVFWAVRKLIEWQARDRPVVVVIDDIHWAEPTLLDLIEHVSEWTHDAPVLLLCMTRPELLDRRSGWSGGKMNAVSILLEPLSEPESEQLIENLLGHAGLEGPDRARIAEAAEGNPLYVEEMISVLIEDGLLRSEGNRWVPTENLSAVPTPPSVQALIAARLDRLEHEERQVIERASVVGKLFYRGAVSELSPESLRSQVGPHLMTLVRKDLIRPDRPSFGREETYRFRHLLIRDVAYQAMPKEIRAELHEVFAGWLERAAGDRAAEYEEILGYHLEQSFLFRADLGPVDDAARQLGERAASLLASSGRRALRRADARAASRLLSRAADLLPTDSPERLEFLLELSRALFDIGEWEGIKKLLDELVDTAEAIGDERLEWRARTELAHIEFLIDPPWSRGTEAVRSDAQRALAVFEAVHDQRGLARVWTTLAEIDNSFGQNLRSIESLEHALEHARALKDRRLESELWGLIGARMYFGPTRPDEAIPVLEGFLSSSTGDPLTEARMLRAIGRFEAMQGHVQPARQKVRRSIELLEELGLPYMLASVHGFGESLVENLAGDEAAEEAALRRSIEIYEQLGERGAASTVAGVLARLLVSQERVEEAQHFVTLCREWAVPDDLASQMIWRSVQGRILARRGDFEEAERLTSDAIEIAGRTDFGWRGDEYVDQAEVLRLAGRHDDAHKALEHALKRFEEKGNVVLAERTRALLADSA